MNLSIFFPFILIYCFEKSDGYDFNWLKLCSFTKGDVTPMAMIDLWGENGRKYLGNEFVVKLKSVISNEKTELEIKTKADGKIMKFQVHIQLDRFIQVEVTYIKSNQETYLKLLVCFAEQETTKAIDPYLENQILYFNERNNGIILCLDYFPKKNRRGHFIWIQSRFISLKERIINAENIEDAVKMIRAVLESLMNIHLAGFSTHADLINVNSVGIRVTGYNDKNYIGIVSAAILDHFEEKASTKTNENRKESLKQLFAEINPLLEEYYHRKFSTEGNFIINGNFQTKEQYQNFLNYIFTHSIQQIHRS